MVGPILVHRLPHDVHAFDGVVPLLTSRGAGGSDRMWVDTGRPGSGPWPRAAAAIRSGQQAALRSDLLGASRRCRPGGSDSGRMRLGWVVLVRGVSAVAGPGVRAVMVAIDDWLGLLGATNESHPGTTREHGSYAAQPVTRSAFATFDAAANCAARHYPERFVVCALECRQRPLAPHNNPSMGKREAQGCPATRGGTTIGVAANPGRRSVAIASIRARGRRPGQAAHQLGPVPPIAVVRVPSDSCTHDNVSPGNGSLVADEGPGRAVRSARRQPHEDLRTLLHGVDRDAGRPELLHRRQTLAGADEVGRGEPG